MSAPRTVDTPAMATVPRDTLPQASMATVDAALKALRSASRRMHAVAGAYDVELALLDALYFKNNNQHRISLFWRRVQEVKRLALRMQDMKFHELVDWVRLGFHSETAGEENAAQTAKRLKSAWTRLPRTACLIHVLERTRAGATLIDAARSRYASAYEFLSRTASGGAFIGMMLALCANIARFDILLVELRDASRAAWEAVHSVFIVLSPFDQTNDLPSTIFPEEPGLVTLVLAEITVVNEDEDIGQALVTNDLPLAPRDLFSAPAPNVFAEPDADIIGPVVDILSTAPVRVETVLVSRPVTEANQAKQRRAQAITSAPPKKKKKRARDEIDDIFS